MKDLIKEKYIFLDIDDVSTPEELFVKYAKIAQENLIVDDYKLAVKAFKAREAVSSTAFEDGFAIPHARVKAIKKPAVFFVRSKNKIAWESMDGSETKIAIMLFIPESAENYLDILSSIAQKLMNQDFRSQLKTETKKKAIIKLLTEQEATKEETVVEHDKNKPTVVGVSACATGVVHTYMARDALLSAAKNLDWNVSIETQGQKGQEHALTDEEIANADAVILATDISVDLDRFAGKKIFKLGTKQALRDPEKALKAAIEEGQISSSKKTSNGSFDIKTKKRWVGHVMSGISFMIPFIVFAGITSAIIAGIANAMSINLSNISYSTSEGWKLAEGTTFILNDGIKFMWMLNQFADIGFTVMMAIAGAYIANSIAGRAAIAPAFLLTMLGNRPDLWWQGYFENIMISDPKGGVDLVSINAAMQPLNIVGALIFGSAVGYAVLWINTKWKINKYIQPIMPIIIIPVFLTLIFGIFWIFTLGPVLGIAVGYLYTGILSIERSGVGMALVGLLLGLLAGVDMGGPINKIASFGATAMISVDGGSAMGTAAAAFAVAPLGCGIASLIFRKTFKDDREMGINATILGFMGVSESAIPFAIKYRWAVIIPNIICSGIAGMFAGLFAVQGHVGAWGGPIIAIFAGVTNTSGSFIGILWYLIAIAIGTAVHIVLLRVLVEVQLKGKLTKADFKQMFRKTKKEEKIVKKTI